ncbi:MAG: hypothetical protein DMG23_08335 [Acidobacteria bacterium]|nr:MAG: hypothetical protein DMG23_08335 [Acidobacteriota bacterium]
MKTSTDTMSKSARAAKPPDLDVKKLALIGAGKLGEGLLSGLLSSQLLPASRVVSTVAHQPRADYLTEKYGIKAHTDNHQAVAGADLVLICLKPQQVKGFLHEVKKELRKLALIGAGKLGEGLLSGLLSSQLLPASRVVSTVAHQPRADYLTEKYGIKAHTDNHQAVAGADLVLICLKPQQVKGFLHEVKKELRKDALIISAAASVTTALIERELGHPARVVRAMPNTPCLIRHGMIALARGKHATDEDISLAKEIFASMGRTVVVDEKHMDAITGLLPWCCIPASTPPN